MELPATPPTAQGLSFGDPADDVRRAKRLRYMSRLATGLLVLMGVFFLVARYFESGQGPWLGYVRAFAEAAMVGALADWFAVTALFRYPLGIRIPHTAIIPNKKDRIGESLGRFVQNNFLSREVLGSKLDQLDLASRGVTWLQSAEHQQMLADQITAAVPRILALINDQQAEKLLSEGIDKQLRDVELAPVAGTFLQLLTANNQHQELLNEVIRMAGIALVENKDNLKESVGKKSPWYVPKFVDNTLYSSIVTRVEEMLRELNRDLDHPLRQKFSETLDDFIVQLQSSPEYAERLERAKNEMLDSPRVKEYLGHIWQNLKGRILKDAERPESEIRAKLAELLHTFAQRMLEDERVRAQVNTWLRDQLLELAEGQREQIRGMIAGTVKAWDRETIIEKLELQVGRDLQFIRINGTLVGGAVGLVLHVINHYL